MPDTQTLAQLVKAKYPEYKDFPDQQLEDLVVAKYPEYKDVPRTPYSLGGFAQNAVQGVGKALGNAWDLARGIGAGGEALLSGGASALMDPQGFKRNVLDNPVVAGGVAAAKNPPAAALDMAKSAGHSFTPQGFYEDPVATVTNAASIADPALRLAGRLGPALEAGAPRLLAPTLGRPLESKAGRLQTATKLLQNDISRDATGQDKLQGIIDPIAAQKKADVATGTLRLDQNSIPTVEGLYNKYENSPTPAGQDIRNAAENTRDRFLQSVLDMSGQRSVNPQTWRNLSSANPQLYGPMSVPLAPFESGKEASDIVNQARFKANAKPSGGSQYVDEALTNDIRNAIHTQNPNITAADEQLSPLYAAKKQLSRAVEGTGGPHWAAGPGGIIGTALGYGAGHALGFHPWLMGGAGGSIGAAFGNPMSSLDAIARGMYKAGGVLGGTPDLGMAGPTIQSIALANALKQNGIHEPGDFWSPRSQAQTEPPHTPQY